MGLGSQGKQGWHGHYRLWWRLAAAAQEHPPTWQAV